jgi:hypothetical protein
MNEISSGALAFMLTVAFVGGMIAGMILGRPPRGRR